MVDITPTSSTPKDMKQRMGAVKGINPDDPNDAAFELVTMFVFFFVLPQPHPFFSRTQAQPPPPASPPPLHCLLIDYPAPPTLGGRILGSNQEGDGFNRSYLQAL